MHSALNYVKSSLKYQQYVDILTKTKKLFNYTSNTIFRYKKKCNYLVINNGLTL